MEKEKLEGTIYDRICNALDHNMLSHAYLFEMDDLLQANDIIKHIAKLILCSNRGIHDQEERCEICRLIDLEQCTDLKTVYPNGSMIKKEQLLEIKKLYKTTSSSRYRIYVIYEAEKLNASSANTILKFLEEPEKGIIAFLVAKNRYQVLDTVVSRCQVLNFKDIDKELQFDSHIIDFIQKVTQNNSFYMEFKEILENYLSDKESAKQLLDAVEQYFHELLIYNVGDNSHLKDAEIFAKIPKDSIIRYISIIEDEKQKLMYNVNYKLWLDNLLLRFLEVL